MASSQVDSRRAELRGLRVPGLQCWTGSDFHHLGIAERVKVQRAGVVVLGRNMEFSVHAGDGGRPPCRG